MPNINTARNELVLATLVKIECQAPASQTRYNLNANHTKENVWAGGDSGIEHSPAIKTTSLVGKNCVGNFPVRIFKVYTQHTRLFST